jgi:hypothetical protein
MNHSLDPNDGLADPTHDSVGKLVNLWFAVAVIGLFVFACFYNKQETDQNRQNQRQQKSLCPSKSRQNEKGTSLRNSAGVFFLFKSCLKKIPRRLAHTNDLH